MPMKARLGLALLLPVSVYAHAGEHLAPHDVWAAWLFDPTVIVPLLLTAVLYARGASRARENCVHRTVCFWAGWLFLVLCLVSPLHRLGETLFSAHMAQHEILMLAAAPLLALSRPLSPMLQGLPLSWRRSLAQWTGTRFVERCWRAISRPFTTWWIYAAALWFWHVPRIFQSTLSSEPVHAIQLSTFLAAALLFWWSLFYGRAGYGLRGLYILTTALHTSILGALLTFSPHFWYPIYGLRTYDWGLRPLQDQHLGGLIMWVPAGVVYIAAALVLFAIWFQAGHRSRIGAVVSATARTAPLL